VLFLSLSDVVFRHERKKRHEHEKKGTKDNLDGLPGIIVFGEPGRGSKKAR